MRTADLMASKLLWNSVLSTRGKQYTMVDIKRLYLNNPLDGHEYMKMPMKLMPEHIIKQYKLQDKVKDASVYMECRKGMYGLHQACVLTKKSLKKHLAKFRHIEA